MIKWKNNEIIILRNNKIAQLYGGVNTCYDLACSKCSIFYGRCLFSGVKTYGGQALIIKNLLKKK